MTASTAQLLTLFTGDRDSKPCYRYPLAAEIVRRLEPRTIDDLAERVYPYDDGPAPAIEALLAAYREWTSCRRPRLDGQKTSAAPLVDR